MQHPIKRYCESNTISQRDFARAVGLSEGFVSQLIKGHENCGRIAALKIVEKTGGQIRLEELLTWKPKVETRRAQQRRVAS